MPEEADRDEHRQPPRRRGDGNHRGRDATPERPGEHVRGERSGGPRRPDAGAPATVRFWAHLRSAGPRDYLLHEWEYGGYERQLDLPTGYGCGLEATLRNGQLVVRVLRGPCTDALSISPT